MSWLSLSSPGPSAIRQSAFVMSASLDHLARRGGSRGGSRSDPARGLALPPGEARRARHSRRARNGGAKGGANEIRTRDPLLANQLRPKPRRVCKSPGLPSSRANDPADLSGLPRTLRRMAPQLGSQTRRDPRVIKTSNSLPDSRPRATQQYGQQPPRQARSPRLSADPIQRRSRCRAGPVWTSSASAHRSDGPVMASSR